MGANRLEGGRELPALSALDAVGNGQVAPLLRGGVVGAMRIAGEDDAALECAGALNDGLDDCLRLGVPSVPSMKSFCMSTTMR